jgi:hypothetical protein
LAASLDEHDRLSTAILKEDGSLPCDVPSSKAEATSPRTETTAIPSGRATRVQSQSGKVGLTKMFGLSLKIFNEATEVTEIMCSL